MKPEQRRFVVGVYFTEEVGLPFSELDWQTRIREARIRLGRLRAKKKGGRTFQELMVVLCQRVQDLY